MLVLGGFGVAVQKHRLLACCQNLICFRYERSRAPPFPRFALLGSSRLFKIAHRGRRPEVPGARGLGLLIFETKTHPVTAGIMFDRRIGSLPCELNWIACIPLLLPLFGKQLEDCLSVWLLGHALTKTTAPLNVLASDEPLHLGVYSWDPSVTDYVS